MDYMQQTFVAIPAWGECGLYQNFRDARHPKAHF